MTMGPRSPVARRVRTTPTATRFIEIWNLVFMQFRPGPGAGNLNGRCRAPASTDRHGPGAPGPRCCRGVPQQLRHRPVPAADPRRGPRETRTRDLTDNLAESDRRTTFRGLRVPWWPDGVIPGNGGARLRACAGSCAGRCDTATSSAGREPFLPPAGPPNLAQEMGAAYPETGRRAAAHRGGVVCRRSSASVRRWKNGNEDPGGGAPGKLRSGDGPDCSTARTRVRCCTTRTAFSGRPDRRYRARAQLPRSTMAGFEARHGAPKRRAGARRKAASGMSAGLEYEGDRTRFVRLRPAARPTRALVALLRRRRAGAEPARGSAGRRGAGHHAVLLLLFITPSPGGHGRRSRGTGRGSRHVPGRRHAEDPGRGVPGTRERWRRERCAWATRVEARVDADHSQPHDVEPTRPPT